MSHANSAFAVALFMWIWLRVRDRWRPGAVALLGAAGGVMAMVRDQDVFFVAGPALDAVRHWAISAPEPAGERRRPSPVAAAAAAAAFAIAYAPQLLATSALNGHVGPSQVVVRKMTWTSPHGLEVLFSPAHGFFAWTPLALLAIAGLAILAIGRAAAARPGGSRATPDRDVRWIATLALAMIALQAYISGAVESWTVAGSFGQRRFVGLTPILTVGVAALSNAAGPGTARVAVRMLLALCVWWNLGLLVQFGTHTMDRQRLTLKDNAWRTYAVLPREAPTLVWRYLTDRTSFYNRPRH
jgi:hypothetical protein